MYFFNIYYLIYPKGPPRSLDVVVRLYQGNLQRPSLPEPKGFCVPWFLLIFMMPVMVSIFMD